VTADDKRRSRRPARRDILVELDANTARKVPKKMIGRVLSHNKAEVLLRRMG
jgi:hypothetical protein